MASEEVIQGVLAVNGKIFYEHNTNLNDKTYKLLDCALAKLTSQTTYKGNNSQDRFDVKINIKEYLTSIGKEPTPTAIKYIKEQIKTQYANALQSLRLIIKSQDKKGTSWASTQIPFIETVGYDPENIHIVFGFDFATLLTTKGLIKYHARCLYEIDNPNAYTLGSKLEEYYGMYSNRKRKQNNKLSIKILLEYCPAIPTEEKVRNSNGARNYPARIIEPFQTALQKLYKIGFVTSWKYVSNSPLKEEKQAQLDNKNITDFKLFKKLYIVYELSNFPSELEAIKIEGNNTKICTI